MAVAALWNQIPNEVISFTNGAVPINPSRQSALRFQSKYLKGGKYIYEVDKNIIIFVLFYVAATNSNKK